MKVLENVPLSTLTTFKVGGFARYLVHAENEEDIQTALALSRERGLPWYVLGGGSNILASDKGYEGVLIHPIFTDSVFHKDLEIKGKTVAIIGAGVVWDDFVREAATREFWGIENLAGIPGSVGAAPVQNIGAYGADISDTLLWLEALDATTGILRRFTKEECLFAYRESRFKHEPSYIILRVAFSLTQDGVPHIDYEDLARRAEQGERLDTPQAIGMVVREIRAQKFPDLVLSGTAGSFFKNPILSNESYLQLVEQFPELPGFPVAGAVHAAEKKGVKIPLAWVLDHVLNLRGYTKNQVKLFENQPLVLVAERGATAHEVDMFAREIELHVQEKISILIEREIRMLGF
ncbi:UDP-N-acetylmuramate dehydrogenase [Patescibacteria group bacterium]|nr:UDP-N-acetylmuramate dehydrogenase [Patescibacteria group bacterium]